MSSDIVMDDNSINNYTQQDAIDAFKTNTTEGMDTWCEYVSTKNNEIDEPFEFICRTMDNAKHTVRYMKALRYINQYINIQINDVVLALVWGFYQNASVNDSHHDLVMMLKFIKGLYRNTNIDDEPLTFLLGKDGMPIYFGALKAIYYAQVMPITTDWKKLINDWMTDYITNISGDETQQCRELLNWLTTL